MTRPATAVAEPEQTSPPDAAPLTRGHLQKTIFLLALPVLFEQFLNSCVGFVDVWLSGRISSDATSAIGLAAYVGWLVSMLMTLVSAGTTALVSRHWGANDRETACDVLNRSITLAGVVGIGLGLLFFLTAPLFVSLLGMTGEARAIALYYLRVDAIGHLFLAITLTGAAAMRGSGDMRTPMFVLGLIGVINMLLSSALVFGIGPIPSIGVNGIVIGTLVARFLGAAVLLMVLARGSSGLKLSLRSLSLRNAMTKRILKIGIPASADGAIMWAGHFVFLMIVSRLGSPAERSIYFAAHIIAIRVESITYLPAVAWGQAAATMVGQSLGSGDPLRAAKSGWTATLQACALGFIITLVFFFGATQVYEAMHTDPAVTAVGAEPFRLVALFQIPLVVGIVLVSSLRGAGDTRTPLAITLVGIFLFRLPLGYIFGIVLEWGLLGAWMGMCGDMFIRGILSTWRFARGKWAETVV